MPINSIARFRDTKTKTSKHTISQINKLRISLNKENSLALVFVSTGAAVLQRRKGGTKKCEYSNQIKDRRFIKSVCYAKNQNEAVKCDSEFE